MDDVLNRPALLALASEADDEMPALYWLHADAPFTNADEVAYPNQPFDPDESVHGPWVVVFASPEAVTAIRRDELLGPLEDGEVREFAVNRLLEYAVTEEARLILDPFLPGGRRYSVEELRRLAALRRDSG